jgi:hypothetical protein
MAPHPADDRDPWAAEPAAAAAAGTEPPF